MVPVQGRNEDGTWRAAGRFDGFVFPTSLVHRGPAHTGFRVVYFIHWVPTSISHADVLECTQISHAIAIHHFCDMADNHLGDRNMLLWAKYKPWLHYRLSPMWKDLCRTLYMLRNEYHSDPNSDNFVPSSLLRDLEFGILGG